jgi:DNA polymerase I
METKFQLIDCDYVDGDDNQPIVRLFGKDESGKTVCVFVKNYQPYFYIKVKEGKEQALHEFLKKKFNNLVTSIQNDEKFLPFLFQESKTKLFKIFLKDPAQVPVVRDELLKEGFGEIFEADILFKYRFMADKNLSGMRWYMVSGSALKSNTVDVDLCISANEIFEAEEGKTELRVLSVDIEIFNSEGLPNSKVDTIAMISLAFHPQFNNKSTLVLVAKPVAASNDVIAFPNEKAMLEKFYEILHKFDPDVIVGYNINNFDLPFLLDRMLENKIPRTLGRCHMKAASSRKFGTHFRNNVPGRVVVDVYELVKEMQFKTQLAEKGFERIKRYGLADVVKNLLGEQEATEEWVRLKSAHTELSKIWNGKNGELKTLFDYARKDALVVLKLLLQKDLLGKFIELSKVSGLLLQDVLDSGEAARVENILLREFNKADFVLPLKPSSEEILKREEERITHGLKGALVFEPKVGLYTTPVVYLDFKSMYPSIFIAYNICPTTLVLNKNAVETITTPDGSVFVSKKVREGIIPKTVAKLIAERDRVRAEAKQTKDPEKRKLLDAKQIALKYMTNAFYGYTGYSRARLYKLAIANAVTACGRFLIQKTKTIVEEDAALQVVYGDTDSIMVKTTAPLIEEAYTLGDLISEKINTALKGIVQIKSESVFHSLLILAKKRYAGLSVEKTANGFEERILMKGIETVRRDWCDLTAEVLSKVLKIILKEQNPRKALSYVREIIAKLEKNEIPIEKLVITKSVSKSLREYKGVQPHVELLKKLRSRDVSSAPGIGDRIGFVIIQGPQLLSQRAEDPMVVIQNNLKIDSKYYIENQVLPPIERVFSAIGINRSEILGIGKQLLLSEAIKNGTPQQITNTPLTTFDGFVCNSCNTFYRRVPLIGKCNSCGGEILFSSGEARSRLLAL